MRSHTCEMLQRVFLFYIPSATHHSASIWVTQHSLPSHWLRAAYLTNADDFPSNCSQNLPKHHDQTPTLLNNLFPCPVPAPAVVIGTLHYRYVLMQPSFRIHCLGFDAIVPVPWLSFLVVSHTNFAFLQSFTTLSMSSSSFRACKMLTEQRLYELHTDSQDDFPYCTPSETTIEWTIVSVTFLPFDKFPSMFSYITWFARLWLMTLLGQTAPQHYTTTRSTNGSLPVHFCKNWQPNFSTLPVHLVPRSTRFGDMCTYTNLIAF